MKTFKTLIILFLILPLKSWSYNVGDKFTAEISDGVSLGFTVTSASTVSVRYCSPSVAGDVSIPTMVNNLSVTGIIKQAFRDCQNLTSVSIPNSVTEIGELAFYNCSNITTVSIGSSVTHIDKNAFSNCGNLISVNITDLGKWCEISFDTEQSNPIYYAHHLFLNNEAVSTITIPNSTTIINNYAFARCSDLYSVNIGNSVTSIGKNAFSDCTNLCSVTIPNSVNSIDAYAFSHCSNMSFVDIPNSVTTIKERAFSNCISLTSITIPNSVTSIEESAFYHCVGLSSIEIPSSIQELGYAAFSNCTNLSTIMFNEGLTSIGRSCFARCKNVSSVNLPSSLNSVGAGAFSECDSLSDVTITDNTEILLFGNDYDEHVFRDCPIKTLYLGRKLKSAYDASFSRFGSTLTSVTINNTDDFNFQNCRNLTTVQILDNVTAIPKLGFNNCAKLKSLRLPQGLASIGKRAFSYCGLIDSLIIPDNVTTIGDSAFIDCSKLSYLVWGKSLSSVGSNAFNNCRLLETIYARNTSPSYIYVYGAFRRYPIFYVPYGTKEIYKSVWNYYDVYLREFYYDGLNLTDSICGNNNDDSVTFEYSIESLDLHEVYVKALNTEANIRSAEIRSSISGPDGTSFNVVGVGANALENSLLSNINLPNTIRYIKENAFLNCTNLEAINISIAVRFIEKAFVGCTNLHSVSVSWRKPAEIDVDEENFDNLPADATLYVPAGTKGRYETLSPWNKFAHIVESSPISPGDISAKYGGKAELPIYLKNDREIAGMQFKLTLPSGVTVASEDGNLKTTVTERAGDMTVMGRKDPDEANSYLFVPISFTGTPISGTEGAIMKIKLNIAEDMPLGTYDVKMEEISMATTAFETLTPSEVTAELTIKDLIVGDANDDSSIDIADYSAIVASILGNATDNFIMGAADLNNDGEIDVSDLSALAYRILHPDEGSAGSKGFREVVVGSEPDYSSMEDSDPADYTNTLYAMPALGSAGQQTTLSINMKNSIEATGYQVDVYLPEGVSFALDGDDFPMAALSEERTTSRRTNTFDCAIQTDGALRIICNSTSGSAFEGNDGEVATIVLDIAGGLADGDYPIVMKNIVITDATGNQRFTTDLMKSTLAVGDVAPIYDENYNLQVIPFQIAAGTDNAIDLLMKNKDAGEINMVDFDLVLPAGITLYQEDGDYILDAGSRAGSRFRCDVDENSDGSLFISAYFTRTSSKFSGTSGDIASLPLVADDGLADGIYEIELKNIKFNDDNTIQIAPYKASVFVGHPDVTNAVLYGNYTADAVDALNDCLSTCSNLVNIDLSQAVAIEDDVEILPANTNCLIYVPDGAMLANTDNVVEGDGCDNLVLTDGEPFSAVKDFTATAASYTRNVTSKYGTICLPYAVSSDASVKYYSLDRVEGSTLYLTEEAEIAAGVPAVYENLTDDNTVSATAANASIKSSIVMPADGDLKLIGTFEKLVITDPTELAKSYYISKDQFHQATNSLTINPFRAYFTYTGSSSSKVFNIATEDDITAVGSLDSESAEVEGIYSISGAKLPSLQKGINIVKYNNGKTQKIIVK